MIVDSPLVAVPEVPLAPQVREGPEGPRENLFAPSDAGVAGPPERAPAPSRSVERWLAPGRRADDAPRELPMTTLALAEALLKSPARVLDALDTRPEVLARLVALAGGALAVSGVGVASFAGDLQLLAVPLKLTLGTLLCAVICLPSLHVFSCLSGASQTLRQTFGALVMGVALMAVLLCGFAPVVWVFAQATSSVAVVGALHLAFFLVSAALGLSLTRRALSALNDAPIGASGPWCLMFVAVLLQVATTLRPLVGPFDGVVLHERMFFLAHWATCLG